jgi:hypothetical protein
MKTLLMPIVLLLSFAVYANELSWVNEQVEAIKPSRLGMSSNSLATIEDPFIFLKKNTSEDKKSSTSKTVVSNSTIKTVQQHRQKQVLTLGLILNSSAMINQKWYQKGDKISGYKIEEIHPGSVLLSKNKKHLLLSTKSVSTNIKFKNK